MKGRESAIRFLNIAQGSDQESRYYLILANDLEYGDTSELLLQYGDTSELLLPDRRSK
ncbi:four helix bundle protein [Okeania sp. SIO3I5]|uniref:four helix bundle protein n=1 Tax=Okeania sp. SIO3I5 TaxID=2607805 RepID=UPI0025EF0BDA|nr:four helix bundle protein [Okeania sp. SIO3I5]